MTARHRIDPELVERWTDTWPDALALWSRFTRLRPPLLCRTTREAKREGLTGSFAMIRLHDQSVVVDLQQVVALGLAERPLEVLGHEIGHHILAPATLGTSGRVIARMRVALPGVEQAAPTLANMYADLLINDRLQRDRGLAIDALYRAITTAGGTAPKGLWAMYLRTYEILWALQRGSLCPPEASGEGRVEADAQLCARLVRSYAGQWADGAGRFAALCFAYLERDAAKALEPSTAWQDAATPGAGAEAPAGLTAVDGDEAAGAIHPALDPALNGLGEGGGGDGSAEGVGAPVPAMGSDGGAGQRREPFEYGEILRALGLDLTGHEVAVRYYRELAQPHLIPFPSRDQPVHGETLPEGYRQWAAGEPLEDIDWVQSVLTSPVVVPGVTTVQRVHGVDDTVPPKPVPLHLDLYVDCSGSMPNPQLRLSYPALAGTVLVLSALRAGAKVQATLWSGARQFQTTQRFTDDRDTILRVVLGYLGGGTAFPLHVLRDTYADRTEHDPPVHVVVLSDSGITTIFQDDEHGTPGAEVQADALRAARGGGTWVLELRPGFGLPKREESEALGWRIEEVSDLEGMVAFSRRFARQTYTHKTPPNRRDRGLNATSARFGTIPATEPGCADG